MHGVSGDQRAGRGRDLFEQRRERGDFVALRVDGDLVERQAQVMGDGREQLQGLAIVAAAAAQDFAVHGQAGQGADFLDRKSVV